MAAPTMDPGATLTKVSPVAPPRTANGLVRVCANLLPEEIISGRRLRHLQRRLVVVIGAIVLIIGLGYGFSRWQTSQAEDDLSSAQAQTESLTAQSAKFDDLVQAQTRTSALQTQLQSVMADDISWRRLLGSVNQSSSGLVSVTAVTGQLLSGGSGTGGVTSGAVTSDPLNSSGQPIIGQVTVSGITPDYTAVARFVQRLGAIKGFTVVDPANVSSGNGTTLSYTVNVSLTADVLGGRFSTPAGTPTSSNTGGGSATVPSGATAGTPGGKK